MFNDDRNGLNPHLNTFQAPEGVAPSRHVLTKQHYLENKRARLEAEETQRRGIVAEHTVATALTWLHWMLTAVRDLVRVASIRRRANDI